MSNQPSVGPMSGASATETMPMRGASTSAQPIASSSGGVAIGIRIMARNRWRAGRSVRSSSQLSAVATTIASIVLAAAKINVLRTSRQS